MKKIFFRQLALKSFLFCALFFTSAFQLVNAQTTTLSGIVTSEDGELLPGASVFVVGTKIGVTTDFDGNFLINVPSDAKMISVSYLGFKSLLIAYLGQKNINVSLKSDDNVLEEIVVVGYGTQRAQDVTGSISKVKLEAIERTVNTTVEQALTGRIAGVNTTSSDGSLGGGIRIRIRGGTSINANNEPLYVIDGMPIEVNYDVEASSSALSGPQSSPLANLDPGSIQSIEVLKDASAAAIYGARGANGVVIITTKTGKAGKAKMTFDLSTSISSVPKSRYVGVMNTSQYGTNLINAQLYSGGIERELTFPGEVRGEAYNNLDEYQAIYDRAPNTNWQEEIYTIGIISNYAFGVSGGSDGNLYSVRASYLDNQGTVSNSFFKRYNTTFNFQNKINDKFKIVSVLAPSLSIKQGPTSSGDFNQRNMGSVIKGLTRQPDRQVGETFEDESSGDPGVWLDPVSEAKRTQSLQKTYGFNGNLNFIYKMTKGLTANVRLGLNYKDGVSKAFYPGAFGKGQFTQGLGTRFHYKNLNINSQYMFTYRTTFGAKDKHKVTLLGGYTKTDSKRDTEYLQSTVFEVESLGYEGLQNGLVPLAPQTFLTDKTMISYLSRLNYGFSNRYNFTFSIRADGSSVFINDKWAYFPAAAFAWNAHNEKFLKNVDAISNLKVRLSYGQTGNAGIAPYASFGLMDPANYIFGNTTAAGLGSGSITNPNLRWESTDQYNIGLEVGLLDNRINLSADVYYKETSDLLLRMPLPLSSGFPSWLTNVGGVENKGIELSLNTVNFDGAFKWSTDVNFAMNRNKVLSLGEAFEQTFTDQFTNGQSTGLLRVGESLGNWLGYQTDGVFRYEDFIDPTVENPVLKPEVMEQYAHGTSSASPTYGDLKYIDQDGDNKITANDAKIIARTQPKHFGSVFNNFSYKGFELGLFFTYKYGFDVVNGNQHRINGTGGPNWNKMTERVDAWTPVNNTGKYPRADYLADKKFTDLSVEDGSFVRFQSLNFSYQLPSKYVKDMGFNSFKIYTNVDNIYVWTKYSGYDPEVSVANGQRAITSAGLDYGAYPRTLNVSFGVNVGF